MIKKKKVIILEDEYICDLCGEVIYRGGQNINDKDYCYRCKDIITYIKSSLDWMDIVHPKLEKLAKEIKEEE